MSQKPETTFKNRVRPQLESLPFSYWEKIQQVCIRGTPDFLGCIHGRMIALELKASRKAKLDPLQVYSLDRIDRAGGIALVTCPENWDDCFSLLKSIGKDFDAHAKIWDAARRFF